MTLKEKKKLLGFLNKIYNRYGEGFLDDDIVKLDKFCFTLQNEIEQEENLNDSTTKERTRIIA